MTINDLDDRLLGLLRANARTPLADLARQLGVARSTVQARLERLERSGTIRGYTIRTARADQQMQAQVLLTVNPREQLGVERALARLPGVIALHTVAGPHDAIATVAAASPPALDATLDAIRAVPGVEGTTSLVLLSRKFERA